MKPSDYLFCVDHANSTEESALFVFTPASHWNQFRCLDDSGEDIEGLPEDFMQLMESCYEYYNPTCLTGEAVIAAGLKELVNAGFVHSPDMSEWMNNMEE